jgi:dethiobiotin synthetase
MQSVFITGTDTGVGKTHISCALMRQLIAAGYRVVGMKPVASGGHAVAGKLMNADAQQLMATANVTAPYEWVNPYCFEAAIAPHIAAQETGVSINADVILRAYQQLAALADIVIVEGVGGWAVPINTTQSMADIAAVLNLPVIMVVGLRLGCLNHALLTAQSIQASSTTLTAWVANTLDASMPALQANIDSLKRRLVAPLIGVVPEQTQINPSANISFDLSHVSAC